VLAECLLELGPLLLERNERGELGLDVALLENRKAELAQRQLARRRR